MAGGMTMTLSEIIEFNWHNAIKQHYGKTVCDDCYEFKPCTRVILGNYVCHECYVKRNEVREAKLRQAEIEREWERIEIVARDEMQDEEAMILLDEEVPI
jgi:hypothetical protein